MIKRRHLDICRCFDFESPQVPQKQRGRHARSRTGGSPASYLTNLAKKNVASTKAVLIPVIQVMIFHVWSFMALCKSALAACKSPPA